MTSALAPYDAARKVLAPAPRYRGSRVYARTTDWLASISAGAVTAHGRMVRI
jgi:hypothetical protein